MSASPPLRFLAVVLGGWVAARTVLIAPLWSTAPADAAAAAESSSALPRSRLEARPRPRSVPPGAGPPAAFAAAIGRPPIGPTRPPPLPALSAQVDSPPNPAPGAAPIAAAAPLFLPPPIAPPPGSDPAIPSPGRWSLSAWAFVRQGDRAALATGGLLGASQAGARLAYRLNRDSSRPLALSARLSSPLRRSAGAEAALGVDWKPSRGAPVHLLAERRQALGREGRSAFALTLYGGVGDSPAGPFRIDGYAQAGFVGVRSRDPFADGSVRLSIPLGGRVRLGAGAWASAQPGLSRIDLGPQAAVRIPVGRRAVTFAADWRVRAAGNAEPGSGPTVTLSTDF